MNILNLGYDSTNYYLLLARSGLLVDCGWPGTLPKLASACRQKNVTFADIKYLLVTHYHPDHAGLAQELINLGLRLLVIDRQTAFIPGLAQYMKPAQHYLEIDLRDNILLPIPATRAFLFGLGIAGQVVHTPGHSDDSVSLVLDEKIAFTGDLQPPYFSADPDDDTHRSWDLLRSLGVKTVYPGHGPVITLS